MGLSACMIPLILLSTFLMLMQSRILHLVKLLIMQNILITLYLFLKATSLDNTELFFSASVTFLIKVVILPIGLWRFVTYLNLSHKIDPLINKPTLMFSAVLLCVFSLILTHRLMFVTGTAETLFSFSLSLANAMIAILLIVFRRKALSQVIGLLAMENSIFLVSVTSTEGFPWIVELGMGFDVLMGFMIFVLFLLRIRIIHGSLATRYLEKLKESP